MMNTTINFLGEAELTSRKGLNSKLKKENFVENEKVVPLNNKEVNKQNIQEMANLVASIEKEPAKVSGKASTNSIFGKIISKIRQFLEKILG